MAEKVVELRQISKTYGGARALDHVDFDLYKGEVLCLVGENGSGKSTLIKIIAGDTVPDDGRSARVEGVSVIYQDLSLFPNLSVAENICFPLYRNGKRPSRRTQNGLAAEILEKLHAEIDLQKPVGELPIAKRQVAAIARALIVKSSVIIMDEPTSSLSLGEIEALFRMIEDLRREGISVLFVSHKLDEIVRIADRVAVIRDGRIQKVLRREELEQADLPYLISGRRIRFSRKSVYLEGEEILRAVKIGRNGEFQDISFSLRKGQVIGLAGAMGCGKCEIAETLFGMRRLQEGEIWLDGRKLYLRSNGDAVQKGIAYVPEDRIGQGIAITQDLQSNVSAVVLDRLRSKSGLLSLRKIEAFAESWVEKLHIRSGRAKGKVGALSGGNQQKVVLAKWLAIRPKVLILNQPTNGVDIGAKSAIYEIVEELARSKIAVILISDEPQELYYNCSEVLVIEDGRIKTVLEPESMEIGQFEERIRYGA